MNIPTKFSSQLVQWFQRRRWKCKCMDAKWWQYLTWHFGSSMLKKTFISSQKRLQPFTEITSRKHV